MAADDQQKAKRLLRALDLPRQAGKVLGDPKYWTETFCRLYLERCDDALFQDPKSGFKMAEIAPLLARWVPAATCAEAGAGRRGLELRALAVLGGAHRSIGDLAKAEETYASALALAAEDTVPATEIANLHRRLAVLRIDQQRYDEALELARGAALLCREKTSFEARQDLGRALTVEGMVHLHAERSPEAIQAFTEALRHLDPRRCSRPYHSAIHNLSAALTRGGSHPADLAVALGYLRKARQRLRSSRRSLPKLKLRWMEGLILVKFGSTRRAELALQRVREGLVELETPYEVAMVSLDLSAIYLDEARFAELEGLAAETYTLFKGLCADRKAHAALLMWHEAVAARKLDEDTLSEVREALQGRALRAARGD